MWFIMIILVTQCSCSKHPLRIYGGNDAKQDEYSNVVRIEIQRYFRNKNKSITYDHIHLCTASALSSVWVLSAAHCLDDLHEYHHGRPFKTEKIIIRHGHVEHLPGIHDSFSDVLLTILHPLFTAIDDTYSFNRKMKHDIGLLKTYPMNIKSYIKLSAVDYKCFYGHEAVMAGYGITTKTHSDGEIETDNTLSLKKPLQVLKVLVTKCNSDESTILGFCLASRCDHMTTGCGGDSGGPVIHPSGIIGVISGGDPSGFCLDDYERVTHNINGHIIPVAPYIEWIYNIMKD